MDLDGAGAGAACGQEESEPRREISGGAGDERDAKAGDGGGCTCVRTKIGTK